MSTSDKERRGEVDEVLLTYRIFAMELKSVGVMMMRLAVIFYVPL